MMHHDDGRGDLRRQLDRLAAPRAADPFLAGLDGVGMDFTPTLPPLALDAGLELVGAQLLPSILQQVIFEALREPLFFAKEGGVRFDEAQGCLVFNINGEDKVVLPARPLGTLNQMLELEHSEHVQGMLVSNAMSAHPKSFVWSEEERTRSDSLVKRLANDPTLQEAFGAEFARTAMGPNELYHPLFQKISPGKFAALELMRQQLAPSIAGFMVLNDDRSSPESTEPFWERRCDYFLVHGNGTTHNIASLQEQGAMAVEFLVTKYFQIYAKLGGLLTDHEQVFRLAAKELGISTTRDGSGLLAHSNLCSKSYINFEVRPFGDDGKEVLLKGQWIDPNLPSHVGPLEVQRLERFSPHSIDTSSVLRNYLD